MLPGEPGWDEARLAWNRAVDQHPALVAYPESAEDVGAVVRAAVAAGLRVAPQGTGHHAGTVPDLAGAVLLRTDLLREVTVDPVARIARAGAGAVWRDVSAALAPHGLVGLAGSAADVGVAGYLLGGGFSWLARRHGLACNAVTAVELVTADGAWHRVDAQHEPDLFWACRGGRGSVGVVTALEFEVFALSTVYAGMLLYPPERAVEVLAAYDSWTRQAPDVAGTCARILHFPPLLDLPEALRGRSFVGIDGAVDLPTGEAADLLAPLRALGPVIDTFAVIDGADLARIHLDPEGPVPGFVDGVVLDGLPPAAVDALLGVVGIGSGTPLIAVDLRHLEGAVGRVASTAGAIPALPGRFLLCAIGIAPDPAAAAAVRAAVDEVISAVAPWTVPRSFPNFTERRAAPGADEGRFYSAAGTQRLTALQRRYDPDRVWQVSHGSPR